MMSSFCKQHLCLSPSDSDLLNEVSGTFTFYHFTTSLHELQVASLAPLPVPGSSSHKSSATQCYLCMWCFSVYLSLVPAGTRRAVLPSATCVCGVSVFTCPWFQQPQEQCYPVLPVYVVLQCLPVPGSSSHKSSYPVLPTCPCYLCMCMCFSFYLSLAPAATRAECYLCMWCFSVYLSLVPAATRAVLPSATCVCGVTVFTCPWFQQPQEQCYPMLPVYVVLQCLPVPGSSSHKSSATQCYLCMWCFSVYLSLVPAATRAELPSATCVCGVSVFTCPWFQQPQEQCYPVLPVYVVSYPVLPVYVVSYPVLPVYVVSYAMLPVYVVSYPVLPLVRCASQDWTGVATQSNLVLQTQNILNASGV